MSTSLYVHGYANTSEGQEQVTTQVVLDNPCPHCGATGTVYSEAWREWNERYDAARKDAESRDALQQDAFSKYLDPALRQLEEEMELLPRSEEEPCAVCDGFGSVPTQQGALLLAFVRKYAR